MTVLVCDHIGDIDLVDAPTVILDCGVAGCTIEEHWCGEAREVISYRCSKCNEIIVDSERPYLMYGPYDLPYPERTQ